jgi:hypothetical protein
MASADVQAWFLLFSRVGTVTLLIPISVAIWQRRYLNRPLTIFLYYKILNFIFNLIGQIFIWFALNDYKVIQPIVEYLGINDTSFLSITYHSIDYIFLGWFFYLLFGRKPYGIWIWRVAMLLLASSIINYLFIEGYKTVGFFNPIADAVFVFGVAAFYLWHLYKSQLVLPLTRNPYFWICFGLILPHLIGFILFLVGDVAQKTNFPFFVFLSIGKNCFLIIAQIFYAIAFWRAPYARFIPLPSEEKTA